MNFDSDALPSLRILPAERLAIEGSRDIPFQRALCRSVGRGQAAILLAESRPQADVTVHFHDAFAAEETYEHLESVDIDVRVICSANLPKEPIDLCVLPCPRGGDAEMARDFLQQGFDALEVNGMLVATVDNPKDTWLHHEVEKLGRNLTRIKHKLGVIYQLKKQKPLKRLRDFSCQFAFRDHDHLLQVASLPGVFSHRRLDLGARALLETMEIRAGDKVLDIGCGTGVVGFAAATRAENVSVHAIDSNARAVASTAAGVQLNQLENFTVGLTASGELPATGIFDVAMGNPPYYSGFQIAEIFLQTAKRGLKPGGRVYIVTKQTEWLLARMPQLFKDIRCEECRGYFVVQGIR